jgi:hypothetical protein
MCLLGNDPTGPSGSAALVLMSAYAPIPQLTGQSKISVGEVLASAMWKQRRVA